jgi:hypothetical protein
MKDATNNIMFPAKRTENAMGKAVTALRIVMYRMKNTDAKVEKINEFLQALLMFLSTLSSVPLPQKALRKPKNPKNP